MLLPGPGPGAVVSTRARSHYRFLAAVLYDRGGKRPAHSSFLVPSCWAPQRRVVPAFWIVDVVVLAAISLGTKTRGEVNYVRLGTDMLLAPPSTSQPSNGLFQELHPQQEGGVDQGSAKRGMQLRVVGSSSSRGRDLEGATDSCIHHPRPQRQNY